MDKNKEKYFSHIATMDIIQNVLTKLSFNGSNVLFIHVIETLLNCMSRLTTSGRDDLRRDVVTLFLSLLEKYDNVKDFSILFQHCQKLFPPKEFKRIRVKDACLQECTVLGQGDCGVVFLAIPITPGTFNPVVAVKVAKGKDRYDQFLQEAIIMAQLDHANVVKLLAFQSDPVKIVMEHLRHGQFGEAVKFGIITVKGILKALHDIASGMEYISGQKIIHRDLDEKNVFVDYDNTCKIGDFGFIRYVGYNPKDEFSDGEIVGGWGFASPETLLTKIYTIKTDIWAFGILTTSLYKFLEDLNQPFFKGIPCWHRPKSCSNILFKYITEDVLTKDPDKRTDFTAIKKKLGKMLSPTKPE